MPVHRPLSAWVSWLGPEASGLGPVNDGDDQSDARVMAVFAEGWQRVAVPWGDREHVLGLSRAGATVVELDDVGTPIAASPGAVALIDRVERTWPAVDAPLSADLRALGRESLPVRYWLLERLTVEGQPPDEVFAILPWDILDRAVEAVIAGLRPDSAVGEVVEIRHWLTPAVQGLAGPLEQLDHGPRTADRELARLGAAALLDSLQTVPLSRLAPDSRGKLGRLAALLGTVDVGLRHRAELVEHRLSAEAALYVPEWFDAQVVGVGYLGEDPPPTPTAATLRFSAPATDVLGDGVRATLARTPVGLVVTLARVRPDAPPVTVDTGEPDALAVPLIRRGQALVAQLPWSRAELPGRLFFRVTP